MSSINGTEGYTEPERRIAISSGLDINSAVQHLRMDARFRSIRDTLALFGELVSSDGSLSKEAIVSLLLRNNPNMKR